jgi:predicted acylesterase/phospholipase RssA
MLKSVGLVLSAGGALGSWQAGVLSTLRKNGVAFERVLGVSAGALNGAGLAMGLGDDMLERWKRLDVSVMKFSPRLFPLSLFSSEPMRDRLDFLHDDASCRKAIKIPFTVVSARKDRTTRRYARFEPGGKWDGPLLDAVLASCAIPVVFPTVVFDGARHVDGCVWCDEPFAFDDVASCKEVLLLEVVRGDELGRPARGLLDEIDLKARSTVRGLMSQGAAGLAARGDGPKVYRLAPSKRIELSMLSFKPDLIAEGIKQGERDAEAFLAAPETAAAF